MQKTLGLMAPQKRKDAVPRPYEDIGMRLLQLREAFSLNQTEFALRLELKPNTYNLWESGQRRPGIDSAILICKEYGATLDWLYMGDHQGLDLRLADAIRKGSKLR